MPSARPVHRLRAGAGNTAVDVGRDLLSAHRQPQASCWNSISAAARRSPASVRHGPPAAGRARTGSALLWLRPGPAGCADASGRVRRLPARAHRRGFPYEVFACCVLDNRHRVIACEELFRGSIDGASVHPREVVRRCLTHNAAAVIFAHNHPSDVAEPSQADRESRATCAQALETDRSARARSFHHRRRQRALPRRARLVA